jgi:hypothetical protein
MLGCFVFVFLHFPALECLERMLVVQALQMSIGASREEEAGGGSREEEGGGSRE